MGLPGEQILSKRIEFPQNLFYNKVWFLWNRGLARVSVAAEAFCYQKVRPSSSSCRLNSDSLGGLRQRKGDDRCYILPSLSQPFLGRPRLHFGSLFLNGSLIPSKATDVGRNRRGEEGCSSGWVMSGQSDGSGSPQPTNLHRAWRDGGREDDVLWCLGG